MPYVQQKLEGKRIDTITELLKHIKKLNNFQASLEENRKFHRNNGYNKSGNRSFANFERNNAENRNSNNNSNRDNRRFRNRNKVNERTPPPPKKPHRNTDCNGPPPQRHNNFRSSPTRQQNKNWNVRYVQERRSGNRRNGCDQSSLN